VHYQPLVTVKLSFYVNAINYYSSLRIRICMHCVPHWPFGILIWYSSDKKWRYGFKQNKEVPVWHIPFDTVPLPALYSYTPMTVVVAQMNLFVEGYIDELSVACHLAGSRGCSRYVT